MIESLTFVRSIRSKVVALFYRVMKLDVSFWRSEVEMFWSSSSDLREEYLNSILLKVKPRSASGNVVECIDDIIRSDLMTKGDLKKLSSNITNPSRFFARSTSGTTGSRTRVFLTRDEVSRMLAVRDFCFRLHGVKLGDREARLWGTKSISVENRIKDWVLHRKSFYVSSENLGKVVHEVCKWKPDYVYGYSSFLISMSKYIIDNEIEVGDVKLVVCTAEEILSSQKRYISKAFGAKVVEEYGSTEFDIIGFETPGGELSVPSPWLIVESKNDHLLVTDVFRETQSFVRYATGDVGNICNKKVRVQSFVMSTVIEGLRGRSISQYVYGFDNRQFHVVEISRVINEYFEENNDIFDFVIVQESLGYCMVHVSAEPLVGFNSFCEILSDSLERKTSVRVGVLPGSIGGLDVFKGKRSYFLQQLV